MSVVQTLASAVVWVLGDIASRAIPLPGDSKRETAASILACALIGGVTILVISIILKVLP